MDQLNKEQKDLYTKALRQNKDTFLIYAQKNFGLPADSIQNLASRIDVNINQVNTPNFNIDDAGNVPYVQGVGSTGQTIYNIRNKKKGKDEIITQNLDDIAHYYMKWVYNNLPESETAKQPTATPGYKFVKQEAPKKEGSTQGSEGSSEGSSSGDSTGTEDKTSAEDKKDDKQSKIENPWLQASGFNLMESMPVYLYNKLAQDPNATEPEFKSLLRYIREMALEGNNDNSFKKRLQNDVVYNEILQLLGDTKWQNINGSDVQPFVGGYNKTIGKAGFSHLYPSNLETNAPESIKALYKEALNNLRTDFTLKGPISKYKYSGFNDLVKLRLSLGKYNLLPHEEYDLNKNIFKVTPDATKLPYFILPDQLKTDQSNSQFLWTVTIDPRSNKLKYTAKPLGSIINDLILDPHYNEEFLKNAIKILNNYKWQPTESYTNFDNLHFGVQKNQAGGTVDAPYQDMDFNYQIHNYHTNPDINYQTAWAKTRPINEENRTIDHPDAGFTWQDKVRIGGALADLTSAVANFSAAGVPLSVISGLIGTTATATADFTDPAVTLKEAIFNTSVSLGTDLMSLIPEVGGATKVAKAIGTISKKAGPIMAILNGYGLVTEAGSFKKILNGEPVTAEDYRNMVNAISHVLGITKGIGAQYRVSQGKKDWTEATDKIGVQVQDKNGNIQHLALEGQDAATLKAAKSADEQNAVLKGIFGDDSFKVVNRPNWSPNWKPTEWFKTTNNPTRPIKQNTKTGELFIEGKPFRESDVIIDPNTVGKQKINAAGEKVVDAKGKPVLYTQAEAEAFTPNIRGVFKNHPVNSWTAEKYSFLQTLRGKDKGSKTTAPLKRENWASEVDTNNKSNIKNTKKYLNSEYSKAINRIDKNIKNSTIKNIEKVDDSKIKINGKIFSKEKAQEFLNELQIKNNTNKPTKNNTTEELVDKIKQESNLTIEKLKELRQQVNKHYSNNSDKIKLDYSTNLFINGKNYKIENIPNVKQYTPEELTKALKINLKKTGGKIDFDIYKKFINKYGSI